MRLLLLDIENSPHLVHTWSLWDQHVGLDQIVNPGYTLCWSAQWVGEAAIKFMSVYEHGKDLMLAGIHALMEEADAIIHYNGCRHDIPLLNKDFVLAGMAPPSPAKQVDLLQTCKRQFKFPSNKMAYVVKALGLGEKKTTNHNLWTNCMNNDPVAWKKMKAYNRHDVRLLGKLYARVLPWIKRHPNASVYEANLVCPNCGSDKHQRRGHAIAAASQYFRYQCNNCGSWFRGGRSVAKGPDGKFVPI